MKQFTESAEALPRLASLPSHTPQIFLEKARRDWQSPHASFFLPAICVSKGVEPQAEPQGSVSRILLLEVALRQGTHSPSWLPAFPLRQYKMLLLCHVQLFYLFFFFLMSTFKRPLSLVSKIHSKEISHGQKERKKYCILTHLYGIQRSGADEPISRAGTQAEL